LGAEELLDARRGDDRQEPTGFVGQVGDRVRHQTRKPQKAAGLADTVLVTHPVGESTLKDQHDFILSLVNMDRWSATHHDAFDDKSEARLTAPP
jgi:hypothetical protein